MPHLLLACIFVLFATFARAGDYSAFASPEDNFKVTAIQLIEENVEKGSVLVWLGKVVDASVYKNKDGATIEWLCEQHSFNSDVHIPLAEPFIVKATATGHFVVILNFPMMSVEEAKEKIVAPLKSPAWILARGEPQFVRSYKGTSAVFLHPIKAIVSDTMRVEWRVDELDDGYTAYIRQDYKRAFELFHSAAQKDIDQAQYNLGVMYKEGSGIPQDYATAVWWFRLAARQGYALAQLSLGVMYQEGKGVPQDYTEAARWVRLAAQQGVAQAQFNLGTMYQDGSGVPQDSAEAVKWYLLAAEQGYTHAHFNLGTMYQNGSGVPQDYVEAMKWYQLAAQLGMAEAQHNLAGMYAKGYGGPQNYIEAAKWYRLAAQQGIAKAQFNLGVMYFGGLGVNKDYVRALLWLNLAVASGDTGAIRIGDSVAHSMTPRQIAEAKKMARDCMTNKFKSCD